jgi:transcriptional regulator
MYVPPAFAQSDLLKLHDFIESHSFGVLVSKDAELTASHLPFLLDRQTGSCGRLIGHMARANDQWRQADGEKVLIVFSGPHAYVSPSWYEAENVVPTWNYAAVHVYGTFRVVEDRAAVVMIVQDTVRHYEQSMPQPWSLDPASDLLNHLVPMIVGFEIDINHIEGKWKLSQNQTRQRQERVIRGLVDTGDPAAKEVAHLMQDRLL